jgi:hypothetical protein
MCVARFRIVDSSGNPLEETELLQVYEDGHRWGTKEVDRKDYLIVEFKGTPAAELRELLKPHVRVIEFFEQWDKEPQRSIQVVANRAYKFSPDAIKAKLADRRTKFTPQLFKAEASQKPEVAADMQAVEAAIEIQQAKIRDRVTKRVVDRIGK